MISTFHMTIATLDNNWDSLHTDFLLVKSALLYADQITLCSPVALLAQSRDMMLNEDMGKKADYFLYLIEGLSVAESATGLINQIRIYQELRRAKRKLSPAEQTIYRQAELLLNKVWRDIMIPEVHRLADKSGWDQIKLAVDTGLVKIHPLSPNTSQGVIEEFVDVVERAITKDMTYPLFDASTQNLIQSAIQDGRIRLTSQRETSAKHAALADNLLARLPLFEEATINEMLDIRRELQSGLIRFRSAVADFSTTIEAGAWDDDFPLEANFLFHQKVAPAIQEIEEASKGNPYLWPMIRKGVDQVTTGSSLAAIAASLMPGQQLLTSLTIGSMAMLNIALNVHGSWKEKRRSSQIEGNKLYFYYRASKKLSEKSFVGP